MEILFDYMQRTSPSFAGLIVRDRYKLQNKGIGEVVIIVASSKLEYICSRSGLMVLLIPLEVYTIHHWHDRERTFTVILLAIGRYIHCLWNGY